MYRLDVFRNKAYRKMYAGKMSQCYRRLTSIYSKFRITDMTTGEVIEQGR